ncbi:hypothetical protein Hanom_Chr14g01277191 [Helianthus anomalus]
MVVLWIWNVLCVKIIWIQIYFLFLTLNMVLTKPVYQYDSDEIEGAPVNKWLPT